MGIHANHSQRKVPGKSISITQQSNSSFHVIGDCLPSDPSFTIDAVIGLHCGCSPRRDVFFSDSLLDTPQAASRYNIEASFGTCRVIINDGAISDSVPLCLSYSPSLALSLSLSLSIVGNQYR